MKDPYSVLGLTPDASEEELKAKYEALKAEYGEQRFKAGEEGNEGAKKLTELEAAWSLISSDLSKKEAKEKFGDGDYGEIDDLIKRARTTKRRVAWTPSPTAGRNGTICSRLFTISANGSRTAASSSVRRWRWTPPTRSISRRSKNWIW